MPQRDRIGRIALLSLALALFVAVLGKWLEWAGGLPFLGGLIAAFGEAALVGGLADWFAVRALFAHPFGIPFPHTALIPRNRKRLTAEIRKLVVNEWLPQEVLTRKVAGFDFVGRGLVPLLPSLRPQMRELLRVGVRELLRNVEPRAVADWISRGVTGGVESRQVAPWLAELVRLAREQGWLDPILHEVVARLEQWAAAPSCRQFIRQRLERAAEAYRERGGWQDLLLTLGEISGGVDLDDASAALQNELTRFAVEQNAEGSYLHGVMCDGLANVEQRLRHDPVFLEQLAGSFQDGSTLTTMLERVIASLRDEARTQIESDSSPFLELALDSLDGWLARVVQEEELRLRVNDWCRRLAVSQIDQHHALLGVLVEEQMNRLSDDAVTQLIHKRVGEDLNWIRLNGTFVGGMIGVALYLVVTLVKWMSQ